MTIMKKPETKLSPERKATLAAMQALPVAEVKRQPGYRVARASWLRTLLGPMAKDQAGLLAAPLDPALTAGELAMFPELTELVDETAAVRQADVAQALLTDDEARFLVTMRSHQAKLDCAFRVRLRADRVGLRMLADIRRGEPGDPEDLLSDARQLVALASNETNTSWISGLKKGEPTAVEALRRAIPELEKLATRVAGANKGSLGRDQMRRAWTLALRVADRIVTAGQYHTQDLPGRAKDYPRFRRPTARKPRAKKAGAPA